MGKESKSVIVPAVERTAKILEYLSEKGDMASLRELSASLHIPSASAYRILKTLVLCGFIEEIENPMPQYRLGNKLLSISHRFLSGQDLNSTAIPIMKKLSEKVCQTSQLAVLQGAGVTYIEQVLPSKPVSIIAPLRTLIPVNLSASAKAILAFASEEQVDNILSVCVLQKSTPKTVTDPEVFKEELKNTRRMGYALDDEEFADGIGCIAAPIFDYSGKCIAAVGCTGHIVDYKNAEMFQKLMTYIKETAREISIKLGKTFNN